ncbi:hypothetical protein SAMN06265222_101356 [Neorhodopirellula lusitana]|uniref:Uncharacterized protein n=1 Tax=Neorhodopirellula lusitana TaxID=445327 RepID=A0ABY1PPV8_9BACT|nr:hypothetical protein [Neorhodopirellula lusitana]SMP39741.1 hypothetical protein SAMN06265222_101356 [Neorhodopirellula lusitana]
MMRIRPLRFEVMEPRTPLAADVADYAAVLSGLVDLLSREAVDELPFSYSEQEPDTRPIDFASGLASAQESTSAENGLLLGNAAQLTVQMLSQDRESVSEFEPGVVYSLAVFMQDVRSSIPSGGDGGGVFQAVVDLEFSDNIQLLGDVQFGPAFGPARSVLSVDTTFLRGVGAIASQLQANGQSRQLLFEVPILISSSEIPTFVRAVPSASTSESVLLFDEDNPVPIQSIVAAVVDLIPAPTLDVQNSDAASASLPANSSAEHAIPPAFFFANASSLASGDGREATKGFRFVSITNRSINGFDPFETRRDLLRLGWNDKPNELRELDFPKTAAQNALGKKQTTDNESNTDPNNASEIDNELRSGLFYDERLFLEATLIEPWRSPLRLQFRIWSLDPKTAVREVAKPVPAQLSDRLIDIASILRPESKPKPERIAEQTDAAIAEILLPERRPDEVKLSQPIAFDLTELPPKFDDRDLQTVGE